MNIKTTIRRRDGRFKNLSLFQFFDDGIRKRLPKNVARDFKKELIRNIDTNKFQFQLNPRWVAYKKRLGGDSRPFIMFGHYKNAISVINGNGHLEVGFKRTTMHPRANMSMGKLAIMLEYGDLAKGIPARPLWRKTARSFFRKDISKMRELVRKALDG